jgi:hypothetical protein
VVDWLRIQLDLDRDTRASVGTYITRYVDLRHFRWNNLRDFGNRSNFHARANDDNKINLVPIVYPEAVEKFLRQALAKECNVRLEEYQQDKLTDRKIGSYLHDSRMRDVIRTIIVIIVITGLASFGLRGAIGASFTLHARPGDLEFLHASLTFCNLLRSYLFKNFLTGNFETTLSTRCSCP